MTDFDPNLPTRLPVERVTVKATAGAEPHAVALASGEKIASVFRAGAGALAQTISRMLLLGFVLAVVAGYIAGQSGGAAAFLAVLIAIGVSFIVALPLAWQRGGLLALAEAMSSSRIASGIFEAVFKEVIGGEGDEQGFIARTAGKVPLTQAEQRLTAALHGVQPNMQFSGLFTGVLQKAHGSVVEVIRRMTLKAFRQDAAADGGGVDLVRVREALSDHIDAAAAAGLRKRVRWLTIGMVVLTIVVVIAAAFALRGLFAE